MSRDLNGGVEFERQLRELLEEGVRRVAGRARSRLNQARHAALAEAARPRRLRHLPLWSTAWSGGPRWSWMPAAGAVAAAALVAFVLWPHPPQAGYPAIEASHTTVADLDLLADHDGMELMQGGDGQFYEWAMSQAEADPSGQASGAAPQGQSHAPRSPDPDPAADQNSG